MVLFGEMLQRRGRYLRMICSFCSEPLINPTNFCSEVCEIKYDEKIGEYYSDFFRDPSDIFDCGSGMKR